MIDKDIGSQADHKKGSLIYGDDREWTRGEQDFIAGG